MREDTEYVINFLPSFLTVEGVYILVCLTYTEPGAPTLITT